MKNKNQRKVKKYDPHECQVHKVQPFNGTGSVFKETPVRLCGFESSCDIFYFWTWIVYLTSLSLSSVKLGFERINWGKFI